MLRRSLTRAMFRQALAASEACTPTDAPWTLPFGFAARVGLLAAGVVEHELVGGHRDRLADDLRRDPLGQGLGHRLGGLVPARARRSCGTSARPRRRPAGDRPGDRFARPLRSSSFGQERPQRLLAAVLVATESALLVHAEPHRLAEQGVGVLLAGEVEQGPGSPGEHDAMDVDVVLDDVLEVVVGRRRAGPRAIAAKARSAAAMSCCRVASRRASGVGLAGGQRGRLDGVQRLVRPAALLLDVAGVAVQDLQDRQGPLRSGSSQAMW